MNLVPMEDRILVKQQDAEEVTKGGIYLPDVAKEKPAICEVLAVGPGKYEQGVFVPMDIEVGDTIYCARFGGSTIRVDGQELLVLRRSDVLCKVGK